MRAKLWIRWAGADGHVPGVQTEHVDENGEFCRWFWSSEDPAHYRRTRPDVEVLVQPQVEAFRQHKNPEQFALDLIDRFGMVRFQHDFTTGLWWPLRMFEKGHSSQVGGR